MYKAIVDQIESLLKNDDLKPELDKILRYEVLGAVGVKRWASIFPGRIGPEEWRTNRAKDSTLVVVLRIGAQDMSDPGNAQDMLLNILHDSNDKGVLPVLRQMDNLTLGDRVVQVRKGETTFEQGAAEQWYLATADTQLECVLDVIGFD